MRAKDLALAIAEQDYGVADMDDEGCRDGGRPGVRYKDDLRSGGSERSSSWASSREALEAAVAIGRQTRLQHGSALDTIKKMPDLVAESKKRSMRIW